MNLYCGVLSTITLIHTFWPDWKAGAAARIVIAIAITVVGLMIALFAAANFLTNYTNFILLLLYVLVPWTAVNLVDFYLVRHGDYDVSSFFTRDGGVYGRFNKAGDFLLHPGHRYPAAVRRHHALYRADREQAERRGYFLDRGSAGREPDLLFPGAQDLAETRVIAG